LIKRTKVGNKLRYKKNDIIFNGKGKLLGVVVKTDKHGGGNTTNRYEIETPDGTKIPLEEHNILESGWHKEKNK